MARSVRKEAKHKHRKRTAKFREQQSRLNALMRRKNLVSCLGCGQMFRRSATFMWGEKDGNQITRLGRVCKACADAHKKHIKKQKGGDRL